MTETQAMLCCVVGLLIVAVGGAFGVPVALSVLGIDPRVAVGAAFTFSLGAALCAFTLAGVLVRERFDV